MMPDHGELPPLPVLLRRHRQAAGLSQGRLAALAGVGERTVRELERGRVARPQPATLDRLACALGLGAPDRRQLHEAAGRPPGAPDADGAPLPPRVPLPADPPDFCGRAGELRALAGVGGETAGVRTTVVHGPPGIGKTTVVVRAARSLAAGRPDGVFFVDLRGAGDRPRTAAGALGQLLLELGLDRRRVPADLAGRLARYRELADGRRAVLVLDNAADADQVRPLLPAGGDWRVLVSSRRRLDALPGVDRVRLGVLAERSAHRLLARMVDPARMAAEPDAAADLVAVCGGLPLALRIVGSRLASRPAWTLGALMDRLRDTRRRLDGLYAGDVEVRAAFTVSYQQLRAPQRAALRRLALLPWPDHDVGTVADVLDADPATAAAVHAGLVEAGLVTPGPGGARFRLHDLLALFGQERAADEDSAAVRDAALERVRARVLGAVGAAAAWFPPREPPLTRHAFPPPYVAPASPRDALDWFEAHRHRVGWALRRTAGSGRHAELVAVAEAVRGVADRHHHLAAWDELYRLAVASAQALARPVVEANLRNALGFALKYQARRPELALPEHELARQLYERAGDASGYAWSTLYTVGALHRSGRLPEALARARLAASQFEALRGSGTEPAADGAVAARIQAGAATAQYAIGDILRDSGHPDEAAAVHRRGLAALADPDGRDRVRAGMIGYRLGLDLAESGDLAGAVEVLESALAAFRAGHHPTGTAECLGALSEVLAVQGSPRAAAVGAEAVRVAHRHGDALRQAQAWYALGLVARSEGREDDRARCWARARALCEPADLESRRLADRIGG